jgi:hypothetical protein
MYFDIEDQKENNFLKIDLLLQFAKREKILMATDSNSWSKTDSFLSKSHSVITIPFGIT